MSSRKSRFRVYDHPSPCDSGSRSGVATNADTWDCGQVVGNLVLTFLLPLWTHAEYTKTCNVH